MQNITPYPEIFEKQENVNELKYRKPLRASKHDRRVSELNTGVID